MAFTAEPELAGVVADWLCARGFPGLSAPLARSHPDQPRGRRGRCSSPISSPPGAQGGSRLLQLERLRSAPAQLGRPLPDRHRPAGNDLLRAPSALHPSDAVAVAQSMTDAERVAHATNQPSTTIVGKPPYGLGGACPRSRPMRWGLLSAGDRRTWSARSACSARPQCGRRPDDVGSASSVPSRRALLSWLVPPGWRPARLRCGGRRRSLP